MRKVIFIIAVALLSLGCKKSKPGIEPAPIDAIGAVTLSSPAQNSICITGTVISASKSDVELKWAKVAGATNYVVTIKDLSAGTNATFTTDQNQYTATLNRNTPYAWSVFAQAGSGKTSQSETWKFYNAGSGTISYSPFPADNLVPSKNQVLTIINGKTTLSWTGSDADNDILNYDVYLGTITSPPLLKKEILESKLEDVALTANLTYYWKVVTRDKNGNTSESDVIPFSVK
jgi:hypothetical protein